MMHRVGGQSDLPSSLLIIPLTLPSLEFAYPMKCTVTTLQRTHLNALLCFPDQIGI